MLPAYMKDKPVDQEDVTKDYSNITITSSAASEDIFFEVEEPPKDIKITKFEWNNLFKTELLHNRMDQLIWRDVAKTRKIFASGLITLLGFAQFSAISMLPCWLMLIFLGFLTIRQREAHHG